jgi:hypothetical protein
MPRTSVKLIEDSIHNGYRLTTLELEYPRYIHSELMTHRVFSRNAQSSRAIPVHKLIERVEKDKWYPIWVENKSGMSADKSLDSKEIEECKYLWDVAKMEAIDKAWDLMDLGVHKQIVNRLLEPFSKIKVILSSTEWNNFFRLRIHPAAQQEMQELAILMKDALIASDPKKLDLGEWHLPYISQSERDTLPLETAVKVSAARCARVSYLNHDGTRDLQKDLDLHDQLKSEKHMSPFEHQATPYCRGTGNFREWMQYRYIVENDLEI